MTDELTQVDLEAIRKNGPLEVTRFKSGMAGIDPTGGLIAYSPSKGMYVYLSNNREFSGDSTPERFGLASYGYKYAWGGGAHSIWLAIAGKTDEWQGITESKLRVAHIRVAKFTSGSPGVDDSNTGGVLTYSRKTEQSVYLSNDRVYEGLYDPYHYELSEYGFKYAFSGKNLAKWRYIAADNSNTVAPASQDWYIGDPITQELLASGKLDKYLPMKVKNVKVSDAVIAEGVIARLSYGAPRLAHFLLHDNAAAAGSRPETDKAYGDLRRRIGREFKYSWVLTDHVAGGEAGIWESVTDYTVHYSGESASEETLEIVKSREVSDSAMELDLSHVTTGRISSIMTNKTYSIKVLVEKITAAKAAQAEAVKAAGDAGVKAAVQHMLDFLKDVRPISRRYPIVVAANPVEAYDNALQELSLLAGEEVQAQDLSFDPITLIRSAGDVASHERNVRICID